MRLKETVSKKHIHSWAPVDKKLAPSGWYVQRICQDCKLVQAGLLDHSEASGLPASLLHLGDTDWREGTIKDSFPNAFADISYFYGPIA